MRSVVILMAALAVAGCGTKGFLKDIESGAYDAAAEAASEWCARADNRLLYMERIEARREIRQRGTNGPSPVAYSGLDEQTAAGGGPVVRIWCDGEAVPEDVWEGLVR